MQTAFAFNPQYMFICPVNEVISMNKSNNQRYRDTEENIRQAVMELIKRGEELSVRAICQRAGVNRSTFYLHFSDVYDMMDKFEAAMSRELVAAFSREGAHGFADRMENVFEYIARNADIYRAWLRAPRRGLPFPFILPDECVRGLIAFRRGMGLESDTEFNYQQSFFMGGVAEAVRAWLECGCRESPRELTRILLGTFAHGNGDMFIW